MHVVLPLYHLCAKDDRTPFVLGEENFILQASSDPGGWFLGHHGGQRGGKHHQHGLAHYVCRLQGPSGSCFPRSNEILWFTDAGTKEWWVRSVHAQTKYFKMVRLVHFVRYMLASRFSQVSCSVQGKGERSRSGVVRSGLWSWSEGIFVSWCRRETGRCAASTPQSSTSICGLMPSSTTKRWPTFPYTIHAVFTTDELAGSVTYSRLHFSVCSSGTWTFHWDKARHISVPDICTAGFSLTVMETRVKLECRLLVHVHDTFHHS